VLESLTAESFQAHLGSRCRVRLPSEESFELTISAVQALSSHQPGKRVPFSVLFVGGPLTPLPQRTYPLEHDVLGRLDIFIVPLGPDPSGVQRYEAVFN
jgi:hypothetical protein